MTYKPVPVDTSGVELSEEILGLSELLAKNAHDIWAVDSISKGLRYGPRRDPSKNEHPDLVPYEELPEVKKKVDRDMVFETLKTIIVQGYRIEKDK